MSGNTKIVRTTCNTPYPIGNSLGPINREHFWARVNTFGLRLRVRQMRSGTNRTHCNNSDQSTRTRTSSYLLVGRRQWDRNGNHSTPPSRPRRVHCSRRSHTHHCRLVQGHSAHLIKASERGQHEESKLIRSSFISAFQDNFMHRASSINQPTNHQK
jgi:hypothetical protein